MKFYRYPIAIVSYALLAIFVMAYVWNWVGNAELETYWYYFPAGAGIYLAIAVILSLAKLQWEWDVAMQVACVLAPVLWYVNIKEPYKRPVYIFVVNSGYTGKLNVLFNHTKDAPTNARNTSDTLYFNFDRDGDILLNEDVAYIKKSMHEQLFYLYPDKTKKRIMPAKLEQLPADTTLPVLVDDSIIADKGKVNILHYRLDYPQRLR
ncbi:MAG: hypothetical protein M3Q56_11295 [Bacteroidota bacterium]|nr:hypothetical protein [Bacteroidota bacterium]